MPWVYGIMLEMKRFLSLSALFIMITGSSWADDFFNPPPLNPELPPWMQDNSQPAQAQPAQPSQPAPDAAVPTSPVEPPTMDTSGGDEEEGSPFDFESGGGGGGGRGSDQ